VTVRILHTSDVHIGDSFGHADAVGTLVDLALAHQVDAMVIVGDFFDNNRVETEMGQAVVDELRRLPVPVIVLPGNHDPLLVGTIYDRIVMPDHVRVITAPEGETVTFVELDLDIWGKPHMSYDDNRPLAGLPPRGESTWQLALAHGQLVQSSDDLRRALPHHVGGDRRVGARLRGPRPLGRVPRRQRRAGGGVVLGVTQPQGRVRPRHADARRRGAPRARAVDQRRRRVAARFTGGRRRRGGAIHSLLRLRTDCD
jgi:hypothetical protein